MFNINTILTKKVQIYFEIMINYIIAVALHVRRNNVFRFLSTSNFMDDIMNVMNSDRIDSVFTATLELKHSAFKQGESDLHCPQFSSCHDDSS